MRILSNVNILGTLDLDNVQNAAADTDRFLVQDANGVVKFRTGAEVASDIGASVGFVSTVKHEVKLGEAIATGQAVYVTSADGTNMIVSKASNVSDATSSKTLGLIQTGGIANDIRYVITEGLLAGLNTSTAIAGDPVWLGTAGNLLYGVANKPVAPAHMVFIGIVTRVNANNGEIFVKVQNGFELEELHNVLITGTPVDKAVIQYDTATGLWKNSTTSGITGSGSAGQVAYFTGATTQGGSVDLVWDNTSKLLSLRRDGGASTDGIYLLQSSNQFTNITGSSQTPKFSIYATVALATGAFAQIPNLSSIGFVTNVAGVNLVLGNTAASAGGGVRYYSSLNGDSHSHRWYHNQSEQMRLWHTTGNLAIGGTFATDLGQRLQVNGTSYFADNIGLGVSHSAARLINIGKNISGSTIAFGIAQVNNVASDVLSGARVYYSEVGTAAASFTLGELNHFYAVQGTFGAGSAVTTQYGFRVSSNMTGATNNYAYYGEIPSGTGRWNLYMNGTANNYMAGSLGIGITTPSTDLHISKAGSRSLRLTNSTNSTDVELGIATALGTVGTNTANAFAIVTSNTERMRITPTTGNVHIGTFVSDSGEKLQVTGTMKVTGASTFGSRVDIQGSSGGLALALPNGTWFGAAGVLNRINFDGVNQLFHTGGASGNYKFRNAADSADVFTLSNTGAATFSSSVTANSFVKTGGLSTEILRADGQVYNFPLNISSPTNGQVLKYNGTSWVNDSDSGITGSGTTNYLPKFTGASTLGNSSLIDNGTQTGFNNAGQFAFYVSGNYSFAVNSVNVPYFGLASGIETGGSGNASMFISGYDNLKFYTNNLFRARITSGGNFIINNPSVDNGLRFQVTGDGYFSGSVGVGTSPTTKLDVVGAIQSQGTHGAGSFNAFIIKNTLNSAGSGKLVWQGNAGNETWAIAQDQLIGTGFLEFNHTGTNRMVLTSSGNLGLGVTPSAWTTSSTYKAIDVSNSFSLLGGGGAADLYFNLFFNASSQFIYKANGFGSAYSLATGQHRWYTAASGTAGAVATLTQPMTLTANGRLLLGTTSEGTQRLQVAGDVVITNSTLPSLKINHTAAGHASAWFDTNEFGLLVSSASTSASHYLTNMTSGGTSKFYVRADGNVGIGTTSIGAKLQVGFQDNTTNEIIRIGVTYGTADAQRGAFTWHDSSGITGKIWTTYNGSNMTKMHFGGLYNSAYNQGNYLTIQGDGSVGIGTTSPTHRLDVQTTGQTIANFATSFASGGYVTIGRTGAVSIFGSYASASGGGTFINADALFFRNTTGIAFSGSSATPRLWLTPSDNLVIGSTTDTTEKLQVNGTMKVTGAAGANNLITFTNGTSTDYLYIDNSGFGLFTGASATGSGIYYRAANIIDHYINGSIAMRLGSTSNLLLGSTTDSGERLQVTGTMKVTGASTFGSTITAESFIPSGSTAPTNGLYLPASNTLGFATASGEKMRLNATGNLGLGTTSPTDSGSFGRALDVSGVNGAALYLRYSTDPTVQYGYIGYDRTGLGILINTNNALPITFNTNNTTRLTIASTGAATFSSSIQAGGGTTNTSAILQADSTTKGFLPPRMTATQRAAITSPAEGLIVVQTDGVAGLYIYIGSTWRSLTMV